jgi:hypothetical protein
MRARIQLECEMCGQTRDMDDSEQVRILSRLRTAAQAEVVECSCGFSQFILTAETPRRPRRSAA